MRTNVLWRKIARVILLMLKVQSRYRGMADFMMRCRKCLARLTMISAAEERWLGQTDTRGNAEFIRAQPVFRLELECS